MAENKMNVTTKEAIETTDNATAQQPPKKSNKERLKDITASIETGIKELFESDKYKQYLQTMSRFHRYSVNNQVLIYMQNPNATHVAGFNKWRDQFGRNVKKGEKGIKIIAPTPYKKKIAETKLDPDTKLPMFDDNGKPITEEKEIQVPMFRVVSVFDVSQTDGKPLPQLASEISGNVENYDALVEAIKRSSTVPIKFEKLPENTDGYFSIDKQEIVIRDNMSEVQTVSALLHEMAHSKLHNVKAKEEKLQEVELFDEKALFSNERIKAADVPDGLYCYDLRGSDDDPGMPISVEEHVGVNHAGCVITSEPIDIPESGYIPIDDELNFLGTFKGMREFLYEQHPEKAKLSKNDAEVQAESVSYSVCAFFGIKTENNSLGYIAAWSKNKDLPELKKSLELINKTSGSMIDDIEKNYAEVIKERGLDNAEQALAGVSEKAELQMAQDYQDLPDPNISIEDMHAYGYTYENMLPLTKEAAQKLFDMDAAIYMLHYNDTEAMVTDASEIKNFDGIFGIDKEDWKFVKDDYLKNSETAIKDGCDTIDEIAESGDNIGTAKLESAEQKPSLLAKLSRPLPPQGSDKSKSKEMEM